MIKVSLRDKRFQTLKKILSTINPVPDSEKGVWLRDLRPLLIEELKKEPSVHSFSAEKEYLELKFQGDSEPLRVAWEFISWMWSFTHP